MSFINQNKYMESTYEPSIFEEEIRVTYAGFWERFGAIILDWLVLLPLTIVNYYNTRNWRSIGLMAVISIAVLCYKPLLEYLYGATLGKKGIGLKVVNKAYEKVNLKEALLRNIFHISVGLISVFVSAYILQHGGVKRSGGIHSLEDIDSSQIISILYSGFVFVLYLADAICLVSNSKKQSIHDLIAGTYVVKK